MSIEKSGSSLMPETITSQPVLADVEKVILNVMPVVANETIRKARSGKSWKHLNLKAA